MGQRAYLVLCRCTLRCRPLADLLAQIDDIQRDGISLSKCKGHATLADVQAGRSTLFHMVGNDNADHYAGFGVDVAEAMSPSQLRCDHYREAWLWYEWLYKLCSHWPKDVDARPKAKPKATVKPMPKAPPSARDGASSLPSLPGPGDGSGGSNSMHRVGPVSAGSGGAGRRTR